MTWDTLRSAFDGMAMSCIQPQTRVEIPDILDALGVPAAPDDPTLAKRQYVESRLALTRRSRNQTGSGFAGSC